jgi:hypothetical protein
VKAPRTIVVKTLLNADEFVEFSQQCQADDVTQSKKLRDLARGWLNDRNANARQSPVGRPGAGQNVAMLLPGRSNYRAPGVLRMRL